MTKENYRYLCREINDTYGQCESIYTNKPFLTSDGFFDAEYGCYMRGGGKPDWLKPGQVWKKIDPIEIWLVKYFQFESWRDSVWILIDEYKKSCYLCEYYISKCNLHSLEGKWSAEWPVCTETKTTFPICGQEGCRFRKK